MRFAFLTMSINFSIFNFKLRSLSMRSGNPQTPLLLYSDKRDAYEPDMLDRCVECYYDGQPMEVSINSTVAICWARQFCIDSMGQEQLLQRKCTFLRIELQYCLNHSTTVLRLTLWSKRAGVRATRSCQRIDQRYFNAFASDATLFRSAQ
jgi:hypothetical protein